MEKGKVSIILPVYNSEEFIKRTLDSLTTQTYQNIEVLCINDGSSDNSLNILKEYSQKDNRIKVFTQSNSGPAKARNTGLANATGEYLMFCDSDDFYEPDMVEVMAKAITENDVDFAMCGAELVVQEDKYDISRVQGTITYLRNLINQKGIVELDLAKKYRMNVVLWNKIFKANIIKKYGISFPNGFECDDNLFIYEYMLIAKNYYAVKKQQYNYSIRSNSIMDLFYKRISIKHLYDKIKISKFLLEFLNKNEDLLTKDNKLLYLSIITKEFKRSFICDCKTLQEKETVKEIISDLVEKTKDKIKYPRIFYKLDRISNQALENYFKRNSIESIVLGPKYKIKEIMQKLRKSILLIKMV